jgi:hypothetical protein
MEENTWREETTSETYSRWENNIKIYLKIWCTDVNGINSAQDRLMRLVLIKTETHHKIPEKKGNFWFSERISDFQQGRLLHEVTINLSHT